MDSIYWAFLLCFAVFLYKKFPEILQQDKKWMN